MEFKIKMIKLNDYISERLFNLELEYFEQTGKDLSKPYCYNNNISGEKNFYIGSILGAIVELKSIKTRIEINNKIK